MPLTTTLITVEEYFQFAGKDSTNVAIDENRMEFFIKTASQSIENFCLRKFITPSSAIVETFDGNDKTYMFTKNLPVLSITLLEWWTGSAWQERSLSAYPYTYDRATDSTSHSCKVWFTKGHVFFSSKYYPHNWRITYSYGFTTANVPSDLKLACCQMVQRSIKKSEGKEGVSSESFGDTNITYDLAKMPDDIKRLLWNYKRIAYA